MKFEDEKPKQLIETQDRRRTSHLNADILSACSAQHIILDIRIIDRLYLISFRP